FFTSMMRKRPFITLKQATSLDGKIATYMGESKWITSQESRMEVHKDRCLHDAILVGVNTVINDNTELTVQLTERNKPPPRLRSDTNISTPISSNVVTDHLTKTWIFVGKHVDASLINQLNQRKEVEVFQLDTSAIALVDVLNILHK